MHDMVLTNDEVDGLMVGLLTSAEPPTGTTRLSRLAGRERGRPRETVRVRAAAQLSAVGIDAGPDESGNRTDQPDRTPDHWLYRDYAGAATAGNETVGTRVLWRSADLRAYYRRADWSGEDDPTTGCRHRVWPGEARRRLTAPHCEGEGAASFAGAMWAARSTSSADPRVGYRMVKGDMPESGGYVTIIAVM